MGESANTAHEEAVVVKISHSEKWSQEEV